jgi:hypothetical protein
LRLLATAPCQRYCTGLALRVEPRGTMVRLEHWDYRLRPTTLQEPVPPMRHPDPVVRRSQRVLAMVHELHKRGYQRLRIVPAMAPSGSHWRCSVVPIDTVLRSHGARALPDFEPEAHYTTGMDNAYFQWEDARHDTARELADKFLERFPSIADQGRGRDWAYAGWYVEMLGFAERGDLPVSNGDWYSEPDPHWLPTTSGFDSGLPMPPPGEAEGLTEASE